MSFSQGIDDYIMTVRKALSAERYSDFNSQILAFLALPDLNTYNFIIDSYYLLEDTQLAKRNYLQFGVTGPTKTIDIAECYLRFYGLFNACFMQKEALLVCGEKLRIDIDKSSIETCPIFDFRNCFAAHSPNKGRKDQRHSYILNRNSLAYGKVEGYTLNSPTGREHKESDIAVLLNLWDSVLLKNLRVIANYLLNPNRPSSNIPRGIDELRFVLDNVNKVADGDAYCNDVWATIPLVAVIAKRQSSRI